MNGQHLSMFCCNIKTGDKNNSLIVKTMFSKKSLDVLSALLKEGFIRGYFIDNNKNEKVIVVLLKFVNDKKAFIKTKQNPNLKYNIYSSNLRLKKRYNGFNISILSTKKGIMSNRQAVNLKLGGFCLLDIT